MAMDQLSNFAYSTVLVPPSPPTSGVTLTVAPGDGVWYPTPPFNAIVCPAKSPPRGTNAEIVRVTARVGDQLTITRQQEGSNVRTILVGDQIYAGFTKKTVDDLRVELTAPVTEAQLPATAALTTKSNVFTLNQKIEKASPVLYFQDTARPVDARVWRTLTDSGLFLIQPTTDGGVPGNTYLSLTRTGLATLAVENGGGLTVLSQGTVGPEVAVLFTGETAKARFTKAVPGNRMDITTNLWYAGAAQGGWVRDDVTKESGLLTIFDDGRIGYYIAHAGANPVGAFDLPFQVMPTGDVVASRNLVAGADVKATGYVYPGYYGGGQQASYYLSAHTTWGLFSNTSVYFTGGIYTGGLISVAGGATIGSTLTVQGGGASITGTLVVNTVNVNVGGLTVTGGATINSYLHVAQGGGAGDASIFMDCSGDGTSVRLMNYGALFRIWREDTFQMLSVDRGGTLTAGGNIGCAGYFSPTGLVYPGRADNGAAQTSWFIGGHASYGLYINTGLHVVGNIWTGQNIYVGTLGWLGNAAVQNGITGYTGSVLLNGVYGVMYFTNGVLTSHG